jgi:glutamate carboxypeptidase
VDTARLRSAVAAERERMVADLLRLANLESPSADRDAQVPVLEEVQDLADELGLRTLRVPGSTSAGVLLVGEPPRPGPFQLLVGHADTVWPLGTTRARPPRLADGVITGPGTYDMKAGIVQAFTAIRSLRATGQRPAVPPVLLVNTDEEIGSRDSGWAISTLASAADRAFVLEPSLGPSGRLKTARKGLARYTVKVHGRAAHAGLDPSSGASAILELSAVIQQLFALNDAAAGVTVNVGTIEGGIQPNVVAPESSAVVDARVLTTADAERVDAAIRAIRPSTPGTSIEITGGFGRPPMERTEQNLALFEKASGIAEQMGIALQEGTAGGGSDGNTTSLTTPTLDGLGAVGDGAHAEHEYVDVDAWVDRAALLAGLLLLPPVTDRLVDDPFALLGHGPPGP